MRIYNQDESRLLRPATRTAVFCGSIATQRAQGAKMVAMKQVALLGFALSLCVFSVSQAQSAAAAAGASNFSGDTLAPIGKSSAVPALHQRDERYRLRAGDSFDVTFPLSPEFNETVSVQPDGFIMLRGTDGIAVGGRTVPQAIEAIKVAYAKTLHDPIVSLSLKDLDKPYFIVGGQVGKPGRYDLRTDLTVMQAVQVAGGFTESSKHSEVVLFRPTGDGTFQSKVLNIKQMLASRDLSEDVQLKPGDTLFVPQNLISKARKFLPNSTLGAYLNQMY